ncbi:MAG: hypothetical protein ACI9KE_001046 [Polyangiales bacterium]|jgi:hypothetical protein
MTLKKKRLSPAILVGLVVVSALGSGGFVAAQDPAGRAENAAPAGEATAESSESAESADTREVNEGDSKVKVFRFSGLDISGRLKSPQLLYFLNRLRAEFDRPKLPHRSFMPELQRSTKTKSF